jgi:predicted transcriptional regulator
VPVDRLNGVKLMPSETIIVSAEEFLKHYSPFDPSNSEVKLCIQHLTSKKLIKETKEGRSIWSEYPDHPSNQYHSESAAYSPLQDIFDAISQVQVPGRIASCEYHSKSQSTTASEISGSSHKIDGYLAPKQSTVPTWEKGQKIPTADLALNAEFKLRESDKIEVSGSGLSEMLMIAKPFQNRIKCFGGATHCMNEDVRRTHTFSVRRDSHSCHLNLTYFVDDC